MQLYLHNHVHKNLSLLTINACIIQTKNLFITAAATCFTRAKVSKRKQILLLQIVRLFSPGNNKYGGDGCLKYVF